MDSAFKIEMLRKMIEIRQMEELLYFKYLEGNVPGTLHQYQGEEAVAVGVCSALRPDDMLTSTHRPVGHCLAKGMTCYEIAAEIYGSNDGCSHGKGGAMHLGNISKGVVTSIAIVGGGIPLATGLGLSFKMKKEPKVAVSFFGDGANNEGTFHESLNMAALWKLPVVFVCENNGYGASTAFHLATSVNKISIRAQAYGIPGITIDGNDVLQVYEEASKAVEYARNGNGPTLIEALTYRKRGHSRGDSCDYRPKEEEAFWFANDPIEKLKQHLIADKAISEESLKEIEKQIKSEVKTAIKDGSNAPHADLSCVTKDVYWREG